MFETLQQDVYKALKAKDTLRVSVLRYLLSSLKNKEIDLKVQGKPLEDKHVVKTIKKQINGRQEAIENYKKVGNQDMAQKEASELEILNEYLEKFEPMLEQNSAISE